MSNFYNFKKSEQKISYEPYLYNKSNTYGYFIFGAIIAIADIVLHILNLFSMGLGLFVGAFSISLGIYKLFITDKTLLIFDKSDDSLIKVTPLGRKKLIDLSNIYSIITVSENMCYTYELTNKRNASKKSIPISNFVTRKNQDQQNIMFLETEIIPSLELFLNLKTSKRLNQSNHLI
nr:hypothetical protein [uncultured Flavobacterium sp.]